MSSSTDHQPGYTGEPPRGGYDNRPTSVAAIIGLIGAFVFWPVGLIASIIGISHTKPGRKKGRGIAIAGLIVSILAAIVAIFIVVAIAGAASSPDVRQAVQDAQSAAPNASSDSASEGAAGSAAPEPGSAEADVVVDSCAPGQFGTIEGTATVTNSDDSPRSYLITVSANGPDGNRVAELNAAANSVGAGQSAKVQLVGSGGEDVPQNITCVVANVQRF